MSLLCFAEILSIITGIWQAFTKQKIGVLLSNTLFNLAMLVCYIITKNQAAMVSGVLICVRSIVYLYKERLETYSFLPFIFIGLHIILGLKSFTEPYQLLTILAPCLVCYYLWFVNDLQELRIFNAMNALFWFVYQIHVGLYVSSISRVIVWMIFIFSFVIHNSESKETAEIKERGDIWI